VLFGIAIKLVGEPAAGIASGVEKLGKVFLAPLRIIMYVGLGIVCACFRLNIISLLNYIKDELLIVLGTSSSETVLPRLMRKIEKAGVPEDVVGLTVPTGYSFNLDGTCIYLTLAALFVAQATGTHLSLAQQLGIPGILLLTSKGAAGVTGSGFIVLAATLASVGTIPVAGIMLISRRARRHLHPGRGR
jgi:aerobic C4-dicarboxylate transport protein